MFIKSSHMLAIPSTLAPLPVMLGDTRWPRGFCASLVAVGTLSEGNQQVVTFLPHLLDVRFISSLPVMQRPACKAWVDTRHVQSIWVVS